MFWGLTPALDLLHEYTKIYPSTPCPLTLNILVIGGADSRHILQTLARRYRRSRVQLNFYVVELSLETIAKQMLLLNVALQHQSVIGLVPKCRIFMELYGNSLVRPTVAKYLRATAVDLLKMVTDFEYMKQRMPFLHLELKYKERDYLENLLKFWAGNDRFEIEESWDRRLRKMLGTRYDAKLGAFDWDLHMRLHGVGGQQVCTQEYRNFRNNGVAFSWLESEVSTPNRSMVCVVFPDGERYLHYGYLGDMQTGPFIAFGLDCEDKEYLQSSNGQNAHRATDVTERNLMQLFYEIENEDEYKHEGVSDVKLGGVTMREPENRVVDGICADEIGAKNNRCIDLEQVEIKFISISTLDLMKFRDEYKKLFDLIYFGSCYLKYLANDLIERILNEKQGVLVVENQKFVVSHRDKQLKEFGDEIENCTKSLMEKMNKLPFDVLKDNFAVFFR